jgi:hypothetical protein
MIARRLRFALPLVAAAAAVLAPAAPAGAAQAADFSQPLPEAERLARPTALQAMIGRSQNGFAPEGRVLFRTPPVEAPRSFDLVGVAGETHALEFRARKHGERWSDWVETENGDPVYTGGTDEVQIRSRGVPIEGKLHYVRINETPEVSERAPLARKPGKRRGPPEPRFITRRQWGAMAKQGGCEPRDKPSIGKVKGGVIHHTVSTNNYSEAAAPGIVLGICRFHRNGNGWDDIGYNALVDRFGNVYQGRAGGMSRAVVGAQAEGHNSQTTGVATIATHSTVKANGAERRGVIRYLAWKLDLHGIPAAGRTWLTSAGGESTRTPKGKRIRVNRVLSHSDTNFTECAGTKLRKQIPGIRRAIQRRIDEYGGSSPEEPEGEDPGNSGGASPR